MVDCLVMVPCPRIGKTKVFLRSGQMAELDGRRAEVLNNAAKVIQRRITSYIAQKQFVALRKATITVQAFCRGSLVYKVYDRMRKEAAALKIQRNLRRHLSRRSYMQQQFSALVLQTTLRAMAALRDFQFRRREKASTIIQARWHCHRDQSYYRKLKMAAVITQCGWRGRVARRELRMLRLASRETGALKEAKDKLEKQVEELTCRLQLEKRLRADLEESKAEEIRKLQSALQFLQVKIDEANTINQEAACKPINEPPKEIKETQVLVVDNEKFESLTSEVDNLKALLKSEKKRAADAEVKYTEAQEISDDRQKRLEESRVKIHQLQESLQRLEEKLSDLESENQVLRQQALSIGLNNKLLSERSINFQRNPENSRILSGETKPSTSGQSDTWEIAERAQKSVNERKQEDQELLIKFTQDMGFSGNRPVAACVIYESLLQNHRFEVGKSIVFDRVSEKIDQAIEPPEGNEVLGYWLSNPSNLLLPLQRNLKANGATFMVPQNHQSSSATLFRRMTHSLGGFPHGSNLLLINGTVVSGGDPLCQIEFKGPALSFKQQLMICDNVKQKISSFLGLYIQAPGTSHANIVKGSSDSLAQSAAQQASVSLLQGIVETLDNYLDTLKTNNVPPFLVRKMFTQLFAFINVQLFNSLMLRYECCSIHNGEYVKAIMAELEYWCYASMDENVGSAWDEIKHIRQAIYFLAIHQKPKKSHDEINHHTCPVLRTQQLYPISTKYWDDNYITLILFSDGISNMRALTTDSIVSNSCPPDNGSSILFSVDDISKSMKMIAISDVSPSEPLDENNDFSLSSNME